MASLLGHAVGAVAVWEAGRRLGPDWTFAAKRAYVLPLAVGVIPDLDVVVGMLASPAGGLSHRGPSHSLLFAVVLAGLAAALGRWALRRRSNDPGFFRLFAVLLACAWVHPLLDYLMACGPPVPFFWPLVDRGWLCPVQLIPTAYYSTTPGGLLAVALHPRTWAGVGLETLSLGSLWLAARQPGWPNRLLCIVLSAAGFALTWWIYDYNR